MKPARSSSSDAFRYLTSGPHRFNTNHLHHHLNGRRLQHLLLYMLYPHLSICRPLCRQEHGKYNSILIISQWCPGLIPSKCHSLSHYVMVSRSGVPIIPPFVKGLEPFRIDTAPWLSAEIPLDDWHQHPMVAPLKSCTAPSDHHNMLYVGSCCDENGMHLKSRCCYHAWLGRLSNTVSTPSRISLSSIHPFAS